MKINANYTWLKCQKCSLITKVLPGQTFNSVEDLAKLFECDCKVEKPKPKPAPKKKVVKDAT